MWYFSKIFCFWEKSHLSYLFINNSLPRRHRTQIERIRCSEDVLHVYWTSYVRSIFVLCLRGIESFSWAYWSKMQLKIRVKIKRGFLCFSNFWLTITSFALFFDQYWNSLSFSILSQLFCARTEKCYQRSCGFYVKLSDKSLMEIRKNNQPKLSLLAPHVLTFA